MSFDLDQQSAAALLSVAGTTGSDGAHKSVAFVEIAGRSILEWQIHSLQRAGIQRFLIEVDNIPGSLLALVDKLKHDGLDIDFVRKINDVKNILSPQAELVVLAEAHYFSDVVVSEMMALPAPFIATVDSRDDNAAFERIDLNTRWAGMAILSSVTVQSIGELPDGWSIASSLLRHAVQAATPFMPIAQSKLQQGDIVRATNQADFAPVIDNILKPRGDEAAGYIERRIFGAVGKYLAPLVWRNHSANAPIRYSPIVAAAAGLGAAGMNWAVIATAIGLFSIMLDRVADIVLGKPNVSGTEQWPKRVLWLLLAAAVLVVTWRSAADPLDSLWFSSVAMLLAFYSVNARLPNWSAPLLKSPALIALALCIGASVSTIEIGAKFIVVCQLLLLIAGQLRTSTDPKNNIQA
jgi:hypothetical protein